MSTMSGTDKNLSNELSQAIQLMDKKQYPEALVLFQHILDTNKDGSNLSALSIAHKYISIIQHKSRKTDLGSSDVYLSAQVLLNQQKSQEALSLLDKVTASGKAKGLVLYLRSIAYAQLGSAEPCADALRQAMAEDPTVVFQWRLEPDAQEMRKNQLFAFADET